MSALELFVGWRLKAALAALVIVVLGGVVLWGRHDAVADERRRMAPVIQSYELRIKNLLLALDNLQGQLDTSNAAVDQLKADADAREKAAAAALKAARTQADRYRLRASQIAAARPTGDQCIASRDLIVSTLKEDRQ
jgi:predicted negative regulator of RcsB-dependent stress response